MNVQSFACDSLPSRLLSPDGDAIDLPGASVMCERELKAEIVQSGVWLYADEVPTEVWIVRQNFEYHYEHDFASAPEELNLDGEAFQVVIARSRRMISLGPSRLSLSEAISAAEAVVSAKISWTNHLKQKLYSGRLYSIDPVQGK
jgi:hypothetical protein